MKQNAKFVSIVVCLVLVSSFLLSGCMYAISIGRAEEKPYELDMQQSIDSIVDSTLNEPTSQSALKEKFDKYLHCDGKSLTVFSQEQFNELYNIRTSGKRIALSYDELLFIINDSISLYFKYESIHLTGMLESGAVKKLELSGSMQDIYPYHEDFSEFDSISDGYNKYYQMMKEISLIIYYRIYMHDAGFETVSEVYRPGYGISVFAGDGEYDASDENTITPREDGSFGTVLGCMQLLSLNGSSVSGKENSDHLVSEWKKIIFARNQFSADYETSTQYERQQLSAPLFVGFHTNGYTRGIARRVMGYDMFIIDPETLEMTSIFPTYELEQMMPSSYKVYVSSGDEKQNGPYFFLDRENGTFRIGKSMLHSSALFGKYQRDAEQLTLFVESAEQIGVYKYTFFLDGKEWVYSKKDSTPLGDGYDFEDGMRFSFDKEEVFMPYYERPIEFIRDIAKEKNIPTDQAIEAFFEDDEYVYSFPSVKSDYVTVRFADGEEMTVKEALDKGFIRIHALDLYGISYMREIKN